jgi:prophage regulatory protein
MIVKVVFKERVIRKKELCEILNISSSTIWRWEKAGNFPKRLCLGQRIVGWLWSDIEAWLESKQEGGNHG